MLGLAELLDFARGKRGGDDVSHTSGDEYVLLRHSNNATTIETSLAEINRKTARYQGSTVLI